MALAENPTSPQCSLTSGASLAISTSPRTHARAQSHLFPSSSRGESSPEGVGGPSSAHLHSQARSLVCTLLGSSCFFCRAPVCTYGVLCVPCVYPTGFFVSFCVYTTEFFVGAHWFPPRRGGSAGPSMRVAGLCLRVPGYACVLWAALASTRVEPRTKESNMCASFRVLNLQVQ